MSIGVVLLVAVLGGLLVGSLTTFILCKQVWRK